MVFIMYSAIIFLYYFNDLMGSVYTAVGFCLVTWIGSLIASHQSMIWYGAGLFAGALTGWTIAYARIRWVEKNMDAHIFCRGTLIPNGRGPKPSGLVYKKKVADVESGKAE